MSRGFYGIRTMKFGDFIGDVLNYGKKAVDDAGTAVDDATQIGNAVDPGSSQPTGKAAPVHGQHGDQPAASSSSLPKILGLGALAGGALFWWKRR